MKLEKALKNNRLCLGLTGLNIDNFNNLLISFSNLLNEQASKIKRERKIGGGRKGALCNAQGKLLFILFYLKVYPAYDVGGFIFGVDRSRVCRWVTQYLPLLEIALGRECVLPKRKIHTLEEFQENFPELKDLFIDGTERPVQRPKNSKNRKRRYSGKTKRHTRKNIVASSENKKILLLSPSKNGRMHDKNLLDKTGRLSNTIPKGLSIWVDTGFKGIDKQVTKTVNAMMPTKKSKHHKLTEQQKQENRTISGLRVVIEHSIAGMKRLGCVKDVYRNRKGIDDKFMLLAAGLWNLHIRDAA